MLLGFNWRLHTWSGTTTSGRTNSPTRTSLVFILIDNYQWVQLFPILNFSGLFWMTRWVSPPFQEIQNVVRPIIMPPKVLREPGGCGWLYGVQWCFPTYNPPFPFLTCASFTLRRVGWILTCDTTTAVQSFCETICDRCDWHLTETQPQSQLHSKRCWLIDAVALFRFCHFQFYSGTLFPYIYIWE